MNEKFKLLALEAKMVTADFDAGSFYVATPDRMQLFAELIVRECMRMCDCADVSLLEHNCPKEASGAAGAKEIIKEWFGVEE